MDLEEYKELYKNNMINDTSLNKNDYIFKYVETKDERYLSGAIYSFWYILYNKIYKNKNNPYIKQEDFYNLYIDAILETCNKKLWLNKNSSLYNDKKAPEKAINTLLRCRILNEYCANNRQKRLINYNTKEYKSNYNVYYEFQLNAIQNEKFIIEKIVDFFNNKDYYSAYILDLIINNDVFDSESLIFNKKKLKHLLMTLDDNYYNYFQQFYNLDKNKVEFSKRYMVKSYSEMDKKINKSLQNLYKSDFIKELKR